MLLIGMQFQKICDLSQESNTRKRRTRPKNWFFSRTPFTSVPLKIHSLRKEKYSHQMATLQAVVSHFPSDNSHDIAQVCSSTNIECMEIQNLHQKISNSKNLFKGQMPLVF
jgi:hypothetical protein